MARLHWSLLVIASIVAFELSLAHTDDNCGTRQENVHSPHHRNDVKLTVCGIVPSILTAFHDDYTIDYDIIPAYAKHVAHSGFSGILVGGTAGQHMSLTITDRKKLIDAWVAAARAAGLQIVVQVGGAAYPDVMELARYSEEAGANAILTLPELYFRPKTMDELVSYVEDVSHAAPRTPILYYHSPNMTHVNFDMPAFIEAASARIPNFKGIKFTPPDQIEGQILRALQGDQRIFRGGHALIASSLLLGGRSFMSPAFALFPNLTQGIYDAVLNSDLEKARDLQDLLNLAMQAHTDEGPLHSSIRAGMEIMTGLKMGPPARPLKPISADAKQRIYNKLSALGLTK